MAIKTDKPPSATPRGAAAAAPGGGQEQIWRRLQRQLRHRLPTGLWNRPNFRRWFVACLFYALVLVVLLAGGTPEVLDVQEGQVAPVDVMAPRAVVDRFRTDQLREEAARQAIREAAQDPANFEINPAVALQQEEWVGSVFSALEGARQRLLLSYLVSRGEQPDAAAAVEAGTVEPGAAGGMEATGEPEANGQLQPGADAVQDGTEPGAAALGGAPADGAGQGEAGEGGEGAVTAAPEEAAGGAPVEGATAPGAAGTPGVDPGASPVAEEAAGAPESVAGRQAALYESLPIGPEEVEAALAYVHRELQVELPASLVEDALRAPPAAFEEARGLAGRLSGEFLSKRRVGEGDVARARAEVSAFLEEKNVPPPVRDLVGGAVAAAIVPNLILSPEKVERARQEAMRNVQDIVVREGQVIVRRGDPIRAEHIQLLRDLGLLETTRHYGEWLGAALLLLALFAFVAAYARLFLPTLLAEARLLALLGLTILLVAGLARLATLVPWGGAVYIVPVALASMLVALLIDSRLGFAATIVLAAIVGYLTRGDISAVLVAFASGFTGVFSVSKISQRSDLTRAGFIIGGAATFTMAALVLARFIPFLWDHAFLGFVNGLVSAVATIGLLPYLEGLFGITSTIRLLELSNPNQPLLRKLLMEAPGTYHHSIIVGNLSEAAADAIGADSLLVRVGSLYHDIGKTKRPYFFVENQFGGENPHDKISPSLSTLIIISHVKDGVEMAKEYGLPEVLVAFIREHHGTQVVKYFYQKALENARGDETVDVKDFSYPGPRPQSRETAIVMLADSVEAAVRSLSRPTPGRIEGLVRKIVKEKLAEGELDESDLTLRDLDRIAEAFVRILTGIFHKRVEYPELAPANGGGRGAEPEKKPAEPDKKAAEPGKKPAVPGKKAAGADVQAAGTADPGAAGRGHTEPKDQPGTPGEGTAPAAPRAAGTGGGPAHG